MESPRGDRGDGVLFNSELGGNQEGANVSGVPLPKRIWYLLIVADRKPDWVNDWIETLLGESYYWNHWTLIRRLIVAGLAKKPQSPRYFLGMIGGLNGRSKKAPLVDALQDAPDLLTNDIWKLFEYDGDGENSLANTERFDRSWTDSFLILMAQGKLSRARLLEATIEALERDFNHYRAKWFFEFFDRLEPTDLELKKYRERILGLLGASAPNVASPSARVESILLAKSGGFGTLCACAMRWNQSCGLEPKAPWSRL